MKDNKTISFSLGSFPSLLTVAFIGLKIVGKIDWSWWWVLSPLWIPIGAFFLIALIWFILIVIAAMLK